MSTSSDLNLSNKYQQKTDKAHILDNPDTYIGSVEQIRTLVNVQLPGITVHPLAATPRQLPFYAGGVYFELDTASPSWKELSESGGIALHLSGEYPGLVMDLWAVRQR